jgi:glutathione peroxidase-family protein
VIFLNIDHHRPDSKILHKDPVPPNSDIENKLMTNKTNAATVTKSCNKVTMKRLLLATIAILTVISCKNEHRVKNTDGFKLAVSAKNFPDSTKVYLYDYDIEVIMDSAYVISEYFELSGKVEAPSLCYIFFNDGDNKRLETYKYLYIENKEISVIGEYSDFFNSQVIGSIQQDLNVEYESIAANPNKTTIKSNQLDFLFSNANNQMALLHITTKKKQISKDSLRLFYNKLDSINSNSEMGKELDAYIQKVQLKTGDEFRNIWGNDKDGIRHKVSDYAGKIILLDFWSPECPFSNKQHQLELPKLIEKYDPEDFVIISYFIDTDEEEFKISGNYDYDHWINITDLQGKKGSNISAYDVTGTPMGFLIDPNGMVVKFFDGFYEGENSIEKEIDQILQQKTASR